MTDTTRLSARQLVDQVGARELAAQDVTQAFLDRIERFNPVINAVCTLNPAALQDAAECDRRLKSGLPARPLEGVPVLIKDNLETRGLRTTFGSRFMESHVPVEDAICVERLRQAGAVILGKTNTPEFAADVNTTNVLFGTTRNPWNPKATAGGSSGGSGAALAARFAPLAVGTDYGGSIRIPASFNGVVGIRPVPGRVPVYPSEFGWDTLIAHVVGPMARNVRDAALMLSVMSGPDSRDPLSLLGPALPCPVPESSLQGARIAFCPDLGGIVDVNDEVWSLAHVAARSFEQLGCRVQEACFDASELMDIVTGTRAFGMIGRHLERYESHPERMTPSLRLQVEAALQVDLRTILQAEKLRTRYWRRVAAFMDDFDYIITPTCAAPPFWLDEALNVPATGQRSSRLFQVALMTYAISVIGLPVVALPCGFTTLGLPVGIQLVAGRQREDAAIQAAMAYEAANHHYYEVPDLAATAISR